MLSVEASGPALHLFLNAGETRPRNSTRLGARLQAEFRQIAPSLEDVFIALIRKQELANAA